MELAKWFFIILLADIVSQLLLDFGKRLLEKKAEGVKCDVCKKPRKLSKTKDKALWACRPCRKLYNEERSGNTNN